MITAGKMTVVRLIKDGVLPAKQACVGAPYVIRKTDLDLLECLIKDRDALFGFYDFPAEHCRREMLAPPRWPQPVAETHSRCRVPMELRSSDLKLKPLPPDPFRHQNLAIAPSKGLPSSLVQLRTTMFPRYS
jgi:hypothetical protein